MTNQETLLIPQVQKKKFLFDERGGLPSASKIESYFLCKGKYAAELAFPENEKSSEDAEKGNRIHEYLAHGIPKLGDSDHKLAERCQDQVGVLLEKWNKKNVDAFVEKRYWLSPEDEGLFSGKVDLAYIAEDNEAYIIDYKTGRNEAEESSSNWQLRALAVLLFINFPEIKNIRVAIVQPMVNNNPEACLYEERSLQIARMELLNLLEEIQPRNFPRRTPGELQCKYCKARGNCPEALNIFDTIEIPTSRVITAETYSLLLKRCNIAEGIIEQLRNRAKELISDGFKIPDWEMKKGAAPRKVDFVADAFHKMNGYVTADEFLKCCKVSVADLQTVIKKKEDLTEELAKKRIEVLLGETMYKSQNAPSLSKAKALKE